MHSIEIDQCKNVEVFGLTSHLLAMKNDFNNEKKNLGIWFKTAQFVWLHLYINFMDLFL